MGDIEDLTRILAILVKVFLAMAIPSVVFIYSVLGYNVILYLREVAVNVLGITTSNPFYAPMNTLIAGMGVIVTLVGIAGTAGALKYLKELRF